MAETKLIDWSARSPKLAAFLHGTIDRHSALRLLRGQHDMLRTIWTLACEEWWDLHVDIFPTGIADLSRSAPKSSSFYSPERKASGGCPAAVIAVGIEFPPPAVVPMGTFQNQQSEHLYVNMMPIDPFHLDDMPDCCHPYIPLIQKCITSSNLVDSIIYLTIDETPVPIGKSQRRGGLHVESPGVLPLPHISEGRGTRFIPGAEHHWGNGIMMREEAICGGIYMASNISDTCAIWGSKIIDRDGSIIGAHGDIERMRHVLGPAEMKLKAGQLVWMTDKTPHESLPLKENTTRQFFRLVTGEVSAWFADHCTPNPCGVVPGKNVRVVFGNKFDIYRSVAAVWECGSAAEINAATEENDMRSLLYSYDLGHIANALIRSGVKDTRTLVNRQHGSEGVLSLLAKLDVEESAKRAGAGRRAGAGGIYYFESPQLQNLFSDYK